MDIKNDWEYFIDEYKTFFAYVPLATTLEAFYFFCKRRFEICRNTMNMAMREDKP